MKGLDFEQIVEDFRNGYFDESIYEQELGENWQEILNGQIPLKQAQEEYLNAQSKKYSNMYTDVSLYLSHDDDFLIENEEVLKDFGYSDYNVSQGDSDIINLLQGILTAEDRGLRDKEENFKNILKGYVAKGYNMYPLMRVMQKQVNDYLKANPEIEDLGEMKDTYNGMTILASVESESSPYSDLFTIAKYLGNLEFQYDELNYENKESTDEEIENNNNAIIQAKAMLKEELGKFDLAMLSSVIKNKQNLIRESDPNYVKNALYKGLGRSYTAIMSLQKAQEKKIEQEEMGQ